MATQWVLNKVSDALAPTVSGAVSSAGSYAGGAVAAVGNGINSVGMGINNSVKRYGDGVKDYGNGIMDWTSASTSRAQTANNPLGLSGGKASGKTSVTSPSVYSAPAKSSASRTMMTTSKTHPQKKIQGGAPKKALPAPAPVKKATASTSTPAKKTPVNAAKSGAPNPGALRKPGATGSKPLAKTTPGKPSTAAVPKASTGRPRTTGNATGAANPLGLS